MSPARRYVGGLACAALSGCIPFACACAFECAEACFTVARGEPLRAVRAFACVLSPVALLAFAVSAPVLSPVLLPVAARFVSIGLRAFNAPATFAVVRYCAVIAVQLCVSMNSERPRHMEMPRAF